MLHLQKHRYTRYNFLLLSLAAVHVISTALATLTPAQLIATAFDARIQFPEMYFALWLVICTTAGHWMSPLTRIFEDYRQPIREEKEILSAAVHELETRTGQPVNTRILIENNEAINASARGVNTWTISTGALKKLSTLELAAILAHEQGHHHSGDTRMGAAMNLCLYVNKLLSYPSAVLFKLIKHLTFLRCILVLISSFILIILQIYAPFLILLALLLPRLNSILFNFCCRPIYLLISRITEYRQDNYACRLGLGQHLRSAFVKLIQEHSTEKISKWHVTFHYTHPITHDRIRRLDEQSELTANFNG